MHLSDPESDLDSGSAALSSDAETYTVKQPVLTPSETLYVGNVPRNVNEEEVRRLFERWGWVKGLRVRESLICS